MQFKNQWLRFVVDLTRMGNGSTVAKFLHAIQKSMVFGRLKRHGT